MKHSLIVIATATFFAPTNGHAETAPPVYGNWDCEIMQFSLDGSTYVVSGKKVAVASIEKIAEDAWGAEMTDGYRFAMFDVTKNSLTWHSPASGDTFECRRVPG
ncbi:hypothetical protein [Marivita sp. GX14005]|uniref:hypothetical protein n=1 Tax=Marivita sp. GX14005 TaxID=2942276 RepID=UPI00201990C4|nr:hypothetical protein [Marivita sp. GX14005]MCL3882675.1 hypothetical protein [Marivita sp. GX14005]